MIEGLTKRQQELLRNVGNAIRKEPRGFKQTTYGTGRVTCRTPGCIAGHIVDSEPEVRKQLAAKLDEYALSGPMHKDTISSAVYRVARKALETAAHPRLFQAIWPTEWLDGKRPARPCPRKEKTFEPTAEEALAVIDGILDGRITNALVAEALPALVPSDLMDGDRAGGRNPTH